MAVITILLGIGVILFLGFMAEFLFKKTGVPDLLLLMIIGFGIGPYALGYITPSDVMTFAPLFTTFTLLFLMYDGAFNMSLESLAKGAVKSLQITIVNFAISVGIITGIMFLFGFNGWVSLLVGFMLGGACSAFTMPILKQLNVEGETYSILALESALTDVFAIVFAFTVMEIMTVNALHFQVIFSKIASLFAVAGFIGILAGIIWIILVMHVFKEHKSYMITIAYLILIYVLTEYLNGNGAIAALFFGLMLKNSKDITTLFSKLMYKGDDKEKQEKLREKYVVDAISPTEEFFYSQISFFLKTFFFVYIGILISLSDTRALIIGFVIAVALMLARMLNKYWTKHFSEFDQKLISDMYARGLAAAAIAQVVVVKGIPRAVEIVNIVFAVILFTIVLNSVNIFFLKRMQTKDSREAKRKEKEEKKKQREEEKKSKEEKE